MRLHRALFAAALAVTIAPAVVAHAEIVGDAPKSLEAGRSTLRPGQGKTRNVFAPQAQLFLDQKDTPVASKSAMHDSNAHLAPKSKD